MSKEAFRRSLLARVVAEHADVDPEGLSFRRSPTGKYNTTYFVSGAKRPLVLRIAPPDDPGLHLFYEYRMMRQEPEIHEKLRARTSAPVARILVHARQHEDLGRDFLLMEELPGAALSDGPELSPEEEGRLFRDLGVALREAHAITADAYGYIGAHRPMEPQRDWASAFGIMWSRLLDDIEKCGGYAPNEALLMRNLYDAYARFFDRDVPASLLHMDVWAQNILASPEGRLTGLLDWDRALYGDPEIEFAVLDYCGISRPAFWKGYGKPRDESPEAEIRRIFYFLYELQKYIFIRRVRGGSVEDGNRYRMQAMRLAMSLVQK